MLSGSGKQLTAAEAGLARMMKAHGAVCGGVTADPLLAGAHPSRGVSAGSACALAASLETLLACPGGEFAADALETVVCNAIAAAFAPDGRSVQPMQQANQTRVSREARFPLTDAGDSLFSLKNGRALCALLAALPRFAQRQWMLSRDEGLCAFGYAPCTVRYRLGGTMVRLDVESRYPVSGSVRIAVHAEGGAAFPLHLHIPAWAQGATAAVSGEILPARAGELLTINRQWRDGDEILLTLPMTVARVPAFHQAVSVMRGPLRFAFAPKAIQKEDGGETSLYAVEPFGAALVRDTPIEARETELGVTLLAQAVRVPAWGMRGASCDQPPIDLGETGEPFEAELVPYADAPIRLSVLPQA